MNRFFSRAALIAHENLTGRQILKRLEELNRTQWLSREELEALQRQKLHRIIQYAYQYVPFYHKVFDAAGFHPDDLYDDWNAFKKIPILTKAIIRKNWDDMLTTEPVRRKSLTRLSTSGSTGEPLVFMQDRDFRDAVTADIQRHLGWAGWELGDQQVFIWGQSFDPGWKGELRSEAIDRVWSRKTINAYKLTNEIMIALAKHITKRRVKYLFGYPSSLYHFAQFIQTRKLNDITCRAVFTSAEVLLPHMRKVIEETLKCEVFNRYGTLELGGITCECKTHYGYHISVENNFLEILHRDNPVQPGQVGEIVITNLNNHGMPFIRYKNGDAGTIQDSYDCPCGRSTPKLNSIEGRITEAIKTRDGRSVWPGFTGVASQCLAHPAITQFQIIQKSYNLILVGLALQEEIPQSTIDQIASLMKSMFGEDIILDFDFTGNFKSLPSGKHQYFYSELID